MKKVQKGYDNDDEELTAEIHGVQQGGVYKEEPEAETHGDQKANTKSRHQKASIQKAETKQIHLETNKEVSKYEVTDTSEFGHQFLHDKLNELQQGGKTWR